MSSGVEVIEVIEVIEVEHRGAPHYPDHRQQAIVAKPSTVGLDVPEYTDPTLMQRLDALRAGYATTMRVPTETRAHFIESAGAKSGGVAVLIGGQTEERPGSDTEILFRQESNFVYLSGFDHAGARLIMGMADDIPGLAAGDIWLFVERGNAVWEGRTETLEDFKNRYDVTDVFWIEDFDSKLASLEPEVVFTFSGVVINVPDSAEQDTTALRAALGTARVIKTSGEIDFLRAASEISVEAHKTVMAKMRCGEYESDIESLFRYVSHNYGARFQAYIPIVGGGVNGAALHYNDNDQIIPEGSVLLIDAGTEIGGTRNGGGWTADITRTMPCGGTFSNEQKLIYDTVYEAENECVKMCVPGQTMSAATTVAHRILIQGLLTARILRNGTVDELMAKRMYTTFMPHGLGHSVGLDVHDPGSITPFKAGMVVTCEPGIYFIEELMQQALADPTRSPYIDANVLATYAKLGGYRLEDTVHITETDPENLSAGAPRTSTEIEQFMARATSNEIETQQQ